MNADTVLNQILQNQQKHAEVLGSISARLDNLDKKTDQTALTLTRMESKHNQDYLQYVESKEALIKRIEPLEEHVQNHKEIKAEDKKVWVDVAKHAITLIIGAISTLVGINLNK